MLCERWACDNNGLLYPELELSCWLGPGPGPGENIPRRRTLHPCGPTAVDFGSELAELWVKSEAPLGR